MDNEDRKKEKERRRWERQRELATARFMDAKARQAKKKGNNNGQH